MEGNIIQKETTFHGIDVSHWNKVIDWEDVAGSGVKFAMLKCVDEFNQTAACFEENYQGCIDAHIFVGVYVYVVAMTKKAAKQTVEKLLSVLRGRTIHYGVWLDMEAAKLCKLPKEELLEIVDFMLEKLHDAGYTAGVYCNYHWYQDIFEEQSYLFWIARYPVNDDGTLHPDLDPGKGVCWQYSSHGKVDGISGYVDMNLAKTDISKIKTKKASLLDRIVKWLKELLLSLLSTEG